MNVMINDITEDLDTTGTILVSDLASGNTSYVIAMVVLAALALVGLAAAFLLPHGTPAQGAAAERSAERHRFA